MNTSCESIENKLVAFLDNELSENDRQAVESHLKTCEACQKLLRELKATNDLVMSAANHSDHPVDFDSMWENIQAQVDFSPSLSDRWSDRWQQFKEVFKKPAVWIPSAITAAALVLVIILLPMHVGKKPVMVSQVEEVRPGTGQVFVLKTAASGQPLIWYQPGNTNEKEAG